MKTITFRKHIIYALVFCSFNFSLKSQTPPPEPRFKTFPMSQAFTAITCDENKNVWAGTDKLGIFFLNQTIANSTFTAQTLGTSPVIGTLRIQSMAKDKSGNIWIGHGGINFSSAIGGLERINVNTLEVQHFSADADANGLQFFQRDGIATRNVQQVVVDPNNRVWTAHRYHDLFVSGMDPIRDPLTGIITYFPAQYIVTPGTFSTRMANSAGIFESYNTWNDYRTPNSIIVGGLPYPAYTLNPTPSQNPGTRTCVAISADKGFVYVSVMGYEIPGASASAPSIYLKPRLLKYTNQTVPKFETEYTALDAGFAVGTAIFNGVYANGRAGVWATTPVAGNGFSVLKEGSWRIVTHPDIIPPNTIFNKNAMWGDSEGKVYLGTNNGLIVYNGYGNPADFRSYTLYSKVPYVSASGRSVQDTSMLSNNIIAGCIESSATENFSWIATPEGIMRSNLPGGDVLVLHVDDKEQPFKEKIDGKDNYAVFTSMTTNHVGNNLSEIEKTPSFAVDGTKSSVLRLKTSAPTAYYGANAIYKVEIRKDSENSLPLSGDPSSEEFIERYGQLTIKPIADYDGQPQIADLKYVDFIYKHPSYIKSDDFVINKHHANYNLFIYKKREQLSDSIVFRHPVKFCLPPVLFAHGVWSEVKSVRNFEKFFSNKGYSEYETAKAWRPDGSKPENPFNNVDDKIIPAEIKALIKKATDAKVSAGKVNVIAHSRGGLYTRAYIEGLSPNQENKYNKDVNALVTLNTPHFGSQAANLILDQRVILSKVSRAKLQGSIIFSALTDLNLISFEQGQPIRLGNFFEQVGPAKNDRPITDPITGITTGGKRYGVKNLTVVNDNVSGINKQETAFIKELNEQTNVDKLDGIPIHAVATTIDICQVDPIFCNDLFGVPNAPIKIPKIVAWGLYIAKFVNFGLNTVPSGVNNLLATIYKGSNDGIVPLESMKAGLEPQFVSLFSGQQIAHVDTKGFPNTSGVTENIEVQGTVFAKLKQRFKDPSSSFSNASNKVKPAALSYDFLPNFTGLSARQAQEMNAAEKIVIDPNSFNPPLVEGILSTFKIYQENIDKILVAIEYDGDKDNVYILEKATNLGFANDFSFTTPVGYYGNVKITAYGITGGNLVSEHTISPSIGMPQGLTLQSIKFDSEIVNMQESDSFKFGLLGTFSDNLERKINNLPGITYEVSNANCIIKSDAETIKSLIAGTSKFKATSGTLNATSNFTVVSNPNLMKTVVTDYYSVFQAVGPVTVKWNTFWQYQAKTFILERSTDNINFSQINEQQGLGTNYSPATYSFIDDTAENIIYYRLRILNINNVEVYSQTIQVSRGALSINNLNIGENKLLLYPNPLTSKIGTLSVYSFQNDEDASLKIYDVTGKLIYSKQCSILSNTEQKINFEMPSEAGNGIYLVQLQTKEFTKTVKLVVQ